MMMKPDADSEEAEKPPGKNSDTTKKSRTDTKREDDDQLRMEQPQNPALRPDSRQAGAALEPGAGDTFRKTELWDRPPIFRSEEPVQRQKILAALLGPDNEVPYTPYEDALRNLTAAIIRRQETILRQVARQLDELHDRLDILEEKFEDAFAHLEHRVAKLEREREKERTS
jgi:hypothetical protein